MRDERFEVARQGVPGIREHVVGDADPADVLGEGLLDDRHSSVDAGDHGVRGTRAACGRDVAEPLAAARAEVGAGLRFAGIDARTGLDGWVVNREHAVEGACATALRRVQGQSATGWKQAGTRMSCPGSWGTSARGWVVAVAAPTQSSRPTCVRASCDQDGPELAGEGGHCLFWGLCRGDSVTTQPRAWGHSRARANSHFRRARHVRIESLVDSTLALRCP